MKTIKQIMVHKIEGIKKKKFNFFNFGGSAKLF